MPTRALLLAVVAALHVAAPGRSSPLPNGLWNPMPGGYLAGYAADTGLDVAGFHLPVYAIAAGTIEYAEAGHTRWNGKGDSPYAVRLRLDAPIVWNDRRITHVWYAHLRELAFEQRESDATKRHVDAGERLGVSGMANGSPHLHLGMLLDDQVEQEDGTYLDEDEIRAVLGNLRNRTRLPAR